MPCPFTVIAGIGAVGQAAPTLLVRDRRARVIAWCVLGALTAGWVAYATRFRVLPIRVALEIVSMLALLAGAWRWTWWLKRHGGPGGPARQLADSFRRTLATLRDPWVLTPLVWLTVMLVTEWRGKMHFVPIEYTAIAAWAAVTFAFRGGRRLQSRRFEALESFAGSEVCPTCPLGFGDASRGAADEMVPARSETGR